MDSLRGGTERMGMCRLVRRKTGRALGQEQCLKDGCLVHDPDPPFPQYSLGFRWKSCSVDLSIRSGHSMLAESLHLSSC